MSGASGAYTGPRRILVYGVTGSGKSTVAAALAARTGLPWHSVDDEIGWAPGWVEVPPDDQRRRAEAICAQEHWILDTAYSAWRDVVMGRVELVVALDYPRWFSLQRLVRRSLVRVVSGREVCNGNVESWRALFSSESIVVWHFRSFGHKRTRIRGWLSASDGPQIVRFTRPTQLDRWIAELGATAAS